MQVRFSLHFTDFHPTATIEAYTRGRHVMKKNKLKPKFLHGFLLLSFLSLLFLSSCAVAVKEGARLSEEEKIQEAELLDSISEEKLLGYVEKLSSKDYAGRLAGAPEYRACARWMASLFEKWGLKPAGDDRTYFQSFPNPYTVVFVGGELSYTYRSKGARKRRNYAYEKEYYPGSNSGDGKLTAEVVYTGFGITAPELNYDDYAGVNVKGKIVLIEPEVPVSPDESPELYKEWKPYSSYQYKIKMAVAHGAKGMLINDLTVNADIDYVQNFMVSQVGEAVIQDIFTGTGKTHEEVMEKIKSTLMPQSFQIRKLFNIENFTEHHSKGTGYNVLGLIEGTDPFLKEEVIILGANLDHVGFCYEVMPGANDNASGVAVLLGVAEALARSLVKPKRSVLMIGFGSKEQSFRGSRTYLENPIYPKKKTVVFLNLSMVGCGNILHAQGAENYPELWKFISTANEKSSRQTLEPKPHPNPGRPKLDADIFLSEGIPSISISAYGAPTYPRTTKDSFKTITPQIMTRLSKILYQAVLEIANTSQSFFKK